MMAIIIFATIIGLGVCSVYLFGDDNPIEEVSEKIVDAGTGMNINEDELAKDLKQDL